MGQLLLKELCFATVYLLDALGFGDLYQLYSAAVTEIRRMWTAR